MGIAVLFKVSLLWQSSWILKLHPIKMFCMFHWNPFSVSMVRSWIPCQDLVAVRILQRVSVFGAGTWLSQHLAPGLSWCYWVYRQLRIKRCRKKNQTKSLMKEIYFGFTFDNLCSIFSAMSSAGLCSCCALLFSLFSFIISFQSVPPAFCDGAEIKYWASLRL